MIIKVIVIIFIIIAVYNILLHKNGIENSMAWIILAFVFGYRTIEPINGLKLHPIEIMTYTACLRILIFNRVRIYEMPVTISIMSTLFVLYFILDVLSI